MNHFQYRDGALFAEDVDLARIADEVGTPFYCYSTATIERHYRVFSEAFAGRRALVCYAMKANSNQAVLKTLARLGAGMDVVSEGELRRARAAGVPGEQDHLLRRRQDARPRWRSALREGIRCFNVESEPELDTLSEVATSLGQTARIAIRVNPDVDARTHAKISTGKSENKFGIPISRAREVYARAQKLPGLKVCGVDMHIGSQITDLAPFADAFALLADFVRELRADGCPIDHVDLGGGLGIPYRFDNDPPPPPSAYAEIVAQRDARPRLRTVLRAGAADRRQRRRAGDRGDLCEARREQAFRHRRRGDERPHPPDALRGPPRDPAAAEGRARTRRASSPTSSARSARAATISRWRARCRPREPATGSPCCRPAPMARCRPAPTIRRLLVPEVLVNGAEFAVVRATPVVRRIDRARQTSAVVGGRVRL